MEEIYKDIKGYEGFYQISNLGNVKSLERVVMRHNGSAFPVKEKLLTKNVDRCGYYRVDLQKTKQKKQSLTIHRLLAIAFLNHTPCGHKIVVDHINGDKKDNRLENLQLITQRENASKNASKTIENKTSKYTGVSWSKRRSVWISQIKIGKHHKYLGQFKDEYLAHLRYQKELKTITN